MGTLDMGTRLLREHGTKFSSRILINAHLKQSTFEIVGGALAAARPTLLEENTEERDGRIV